MVNVEDLSLQSREGWTYYPKSRLAVTPLGDLWYERLDLATFLEPFNLRLEDEIEVDWVSQEDGLRTVLNLKYGFSWKQIKPDDDSSDESSESEER